MGVAAAQRAQLLAERLALALQREQAALAAELARVAPVVVVVQVEVAAEVVSQGRGGPPSV